MERKIFLVVMLICFSIISLNCVAASNGTFSDNDVLLSQFEIQDNLNSLDNISMNLTSNNPKTIEITQENYDDYFDVRTGKILDTASISKGDTLKIGNISGRAFVLDRQLTILPITPNDVISNGFIHLIKGSDGSTVANLTINNTKGTLTIMGVTVGQLHGIWLSNSNNNLIAYNTIRLANTAGVYAMPMGWSSNNRIIYNDMKTYITTNIIMGECHYNLISHNKLEVLSYSDLSVTNLIYFNPFGHADYTGTALCKGNIISYNYLKGFCTGPMSIILQLTYSNHDNTVVANNTIIKGSFGINLNGNNVSVYGNEVQGSATGISVAGSTFTVNNNNVSGISQMKGISATATSQGYVFNNNINYTDVNAGLHIGDNIEAHDNIINIKNYGIGIDISGNNSKAYNNNIKNNHDSGVSVLGSYNLIDNNIVKTNYIGVSIPASSTKLRYYNNTISNNKITSENYGISIDGLVYNSVIVDNVIETNKTDGICLDITDKESNTQTDNIVNGVILDSTAIVVNDDNFYQYFDEDGYLTYEFDEGKNKVLFLTFLTNKNIVFDDKINVISNKMNNLLFNVTITFEGDSEGSLIRDFNFINYDKESIVVNNVNDITIAKNNITTIYKKGSLSNSAILLEDICDDIVISQNNIYINSKLDYVYAIDVPAINPSNGRMNKKFSTGLSVRDNTIIMISTNVAEACYNDACCDSEFVNNKINIISDGDGYGLAFANIIGRLSNINITSNNIVIYSKQMAYLIELHMVDNSTIADNTLFTNSNGSFAIGMYRSNDISVQNNNISLFGGDLNSISHISDALGKGNSAIAVIKDTDNILISDNLIYANVTAPIGFVNVTNLENIECYSNAYVIDNENYDVYFTQEGILKSEIIGDYNTLLLNNLTNGQIMKINVQLNISSYDEIPNIVTLILDNHASNSQIYGLNFINSSIILNNCYNVVIRDSIFNSSISNLLTIEEGRNNSFLNNTISFNSNDLNAIILTKTESATIEDNIFDINGSDIKIIVNNASDNTLIDANNMSVTADKAIFVYSNNCVGENVINNVLSGNAGSVFGYLTSNVNNSFIAFNDIIIKGYSSVTNQSAVYLADFSSNNTVFGNNINSFSINADDYAVIVISDEALSNLIIKNYIISSNGKKRANFAVLAPYDYVDMNTPNDVYVAINGSDIDGDGSMLNPYATISKAVNNSLNHAIIYVNDGYYNESNIIINKDLEIVAITSGKVIIDAMSEQLFNIADEGALSISSFIIKNAHNEVGGSVFVNNGELSIYDCIISNSSSYHDNSNPIFDTDIVYDDDGEIDRAHTQNCIDTGMGGVILNNGKLLIDSSVFYDNLGHWGGVIADYGKTSINSSLFFNNRGVHGGVIYSDSSSDLTIDNSLFHNNTALTSLDFCSLREVATSWSISDGIHYTVYTDCSALVGVGGVIYTDNTSLLLSNSNFTDNSARLGGVIATQCDSFSSVSSFESNVDLIIDNCYFSDNQAKDTRYSSGSLDLNNFHYTSGYDGGVVYGTFNKLNILGSKFYQNQALSDGGVLHAKSNDGKILDSVFEENIAGICGGALDVSKNFIIMRSTISNNTARYGGAIEYSSYTYYGHIQDNFNIYNSTISHNRALNVGGAFDFGASNVTIRDSNIVDNLAPAYNTIYTSGSSYAMDMRYNYWGITENGEGPDDSVWRVNNNLFKPWYKQWVYWEPTVVEIDPGVPAVVEPENNYPNHDSDNSQSYNTNPTSTGTSTSTGAYIGGNGNADGTGDGRGNGKYSGNGDGNNLGPNDGTGNGGSLIPLPGHNNYNGQGITANADTSSNTNSQTHGTVDSDSLSKTNSSQFNADLATVGMTANAASTSSSSNGGIDGASSSSGQSGASKSYEITEKMEELVKDDFSVATYVVIVLTLILLVIGYRRKQKENEENY